MNFIKGLLEPNNKSISAGAKKILSFIMTKEEVNGQTVLKNKSIHIFKELSEEKEVVHDKDGLFNQIDQSMNSFFNIK